MKYYIEVSETVDHMLATEKPEWDTEAIMRELPDEFVVAYRNTVAQWDKIQRALYRLENNDVVIKAEDWQ
jgi:hypothetical protein